jgi:hypothetical protein
MRSAKKFKEFIQEDWPKLCQLTNRGLRFSSDIRVIQNSLERKVNHGVTFDKRLFQYVDKEAKEEVKETVATVDIQSIVELWMKCESTSRWIVDHQQKYLDEWLIRNTHTETPLYPNANGMAFKQFTSGSEFYAIVARSKRIWIDEVLARKNKGNSQLYSWISDFYPSCLLSRSVGSRS